MSGRNLLEVRPVGAVLRSRLYPVAFQWLALGVFVLVVWQLLAGPNAAHDNLGTALLWVVWWPLLPILFLLAGRFWCAVCPYGLVSDLVQKVVGAGRPVPRFLKRYGIWIIDAWFIGITWADHVWGIVHSPWGSGMLLLLIAVVVVASGAFLQRRAFCRYVCFLGGLAGNYSRAGIVELRASEDVCATCEARAVCFNGGEAAPACPLFEFPRTMDSSANCVLCANCVKNCPNDALRLTVRGPARELWFISRPRTSEAFLAAAIMGIVLVQNVTMLDIWGTILARIENLSGSASYTVNYTIAFALAIALPLLLLGVASSFASVATRETLRQGFTAFGYALIPLDLAAHLAHNLFHLLAEGKAVGYTALGLVGHQHAHTSTALVSDGTIQLLQFALVGLGTLVSLDVARRIASRATGGLVVAVPYALLIAGFGALNVWLFTMPMATRM